MSEDKELDELKRKVDLEKELIKEKHEVRVSFDSQPQPECVISGRVNFSDGKIASWYFDKTGQLSLNPDEESYSPSEEDVVEFQAQLGKALEQNSNSSPNKTAWASGFAMQGMAEQNTLNDIADDVSDISDGGGGFG